MIRVTSLSLFVAALALFASRSAQAELPVAPQPREVRPDGSRDPAPPPEARAKAEDPAAVVDRIIKNSKDVGDKLEKKDTGTDTRKTQDKILSDIDALINRQEDPPPPKDNKDDKEKDKNPPKDKDPMKNMDMPPPKGSDMPMDKKGMNDGMPMNMDGMDQQPMGGNGRRPRAGEQPMGGDKKEPDKSQAKQQPQKPDDKKGAQQSKDNKDPKSPAGAAGGNPGGKVQARPTLPIDEDVAKNVWGHLPDKLRQQMTQYYKEDVMPKYAELLRLYYSSLSEKSPGPAMPRK